MKRRALISAAVKGAAIALAALALPSLAGESSPPVATEAELIWRTQLLLSEIGFYSGPLDGKMSEKTADAIKRFQTMRGVEVDGKVSRLLINMIDDSKKP